MFWGSSDTPRRPHWRGDFHVSWSDEADRHQYQEAVEVALDRDSWGVLFVVLPDDPYYVVDVDGPKDENGDWREWFPGVDPLLNTYAEWSPSGGIHAIVEGEPPEWWRDLHAGDHEGVDLLTNKPCTYTANHLDGAADTPAAINLDGWFTQVYHAIEGELPGENRSEQASASSSQEDRELAREEVEDALSKLDPGMNHNNWVRVGFAIHDWDSGSQGRQVFEHWWV